MHCRKNQATLTAQERSRFVAAVLALKANGKYDQYVLAHVNNMPGAHRGPAFLPWHREFLRRFEQDLRAIDSSVTLPYWDWSVDNSTTSTLWADDFMGPSGRPLDGRVMSGPFAHSTGNWTLTLDGPALRRRLGASPSAPTLPTVLDLSNALTLTPYDLAPYNDGSSLSGFRNTLEGWRNGPQLHNRVHVWVGGSMGPASSPNDPVFFLHHCFIDKLWADWQALHPAETYLPVAGAPAGHNLNDPMAPFSVGGTVVTPASVLDHHALNYAYDTEGICRPTLKFRDDSLTIKVLDDQQTLKFRDDVATLKFRDDVATLKFRDDVSTLKLLDDRPTAKFIDDGGTTKAVDDVKLPGRDAMGLVGHGGILGSAPRATPFVLSTPHHTMAWTQTFPGTLEATVAHLEAELGEYAAAISELEQQATRPGGAQVGAADAGQEPRGIDQRLAVLRAEFEAMLAEHDQLARHLLAQSGGGG